MIVEFIGSTGAGKTTLISGVQRRLSQTADVTTSYALVADALGLGSVTHPTAQNLIQELVGLPFVLGSLHRHKSFIFFALRMLARQAGIGMLTLNNLRSLERKIGMYEIMRRFKNRRFVLVDEGTVLSAHNVFVYSDALYTPEEIATFCDLLPLPDLIIYIRAPLEDLIRRSLQREDPPREMRSKDRLLVEKFIRRAVAVFEMLVTTERIRERVLIVENPSSADGRRQEAVESIVSYLLNHQRLDGLRTVSS